MSYHVTILRTEAGNAVPIALQEVHDAVAAIGGWRYGEQEYEFVKEDGGNDKCILWYDNGELWANTPSPWALEQMIALAQQLNARVRGDEFETYETGDRWYTHPDDKKLKREAAARARKLVAESLNEQRLIRAVIIGFFVLLGVGAYLLGASFEK